MANKYGEAALIAARMDTYGKAITPAARWEQATAKLYPTSPSAQRKGGPRFAFLSLCEAGSGQGNSRWSIRPIEQKQGLRTPRRRPTQRRHSQDRHHALG